MTTNIITTATAAQGSGPSTLMAASRNWASRPADQRFTSLTELNAYKQRHKANSKQAVVSSRRIEAQPGEGPGGGLDSKSLVVVGPNGMPVAPTHWSFGQLAERAGAPAAYLRGLPAPIAADCINYGLKFKRDVEDLGVLLYKNGGPPELTAVTGPNYGRVWDADVTQALVDRFGDGVTGQFKVPGFFGQKLDQVTKENTTLFASDRDMFVFLADEERRIELPNRRNGQKGSLARGFFVWNSEVGKTSLGIGMFLFDYVCCNRIVWGAEGYTEIRVNHTTSAPDRFMEEILPAVKAYAAASADPIQAVLLAAQQKRIDDVSEFLMARFSRTQTQAMITVHQAEEGRPIETLWDATTAATAYARGLDNQDTRIDIEREAGRILDMAA